MPYRTFVDDDGTPWNVWDVRPQWADRRQGGERRVVNVDDDSIIDPPVLERRRQRVDRRQQESDGLRRVKLAGGLSAGWLIFQSAEQRRRLSPIPAGWEEVPAGQLADMCSRAISSPPHPPTK
jgi:hypothetical protein